jgi:hypothetical protein
VTEIEDPVPLHCVQPGCTFDDDGVCLEGIPKGVNCPHRTPVTEGDAEETDSTVPSLVAEAWISLPDGYELTFDSTGLITRASEAKVVVLAGEPDAGKTTLVTCIFEHFSKGMYAGQRVAWSETVLAFERICYRSRISSDAENADTERTKGLTPRFFHLQLQNKESGKFTDLLVTDVSGEAYRRALDSQEDALRLQFIKRADVFVLLLDGERLKSKESRQDTFQRSLLLLKALLQAEVLSHGCTVRVLIAKYDLLVPQDVDANTTQFIEHVEAEYNKFGTEHFSDFQISRISSRPKTGSSLKYGFGVEPLFAKWVDAEASEGVPDFRADASPSPNERESAIFLWRQLGQKTNVDRRA